MPDFDIIVIGAGPAGEVLAGRTATAGLSTAIVEERLVGGECRFYACMPSKALPGFCGSPGAGWAGSHQLRELGVPQDTSRRSSATRRAFSNALAGAQREQVGFEPGKCGEHVEGRSSSG
jgi:choline dehydrogenase-like flavoprotein